MTDPDPTLFEAAFSPTLRAALHYHDPALIEAAARAYCRVANIPQDRWHVATQRVEAVLTAVVPLIEAATLEREAYTIRERITAAVTPLIERDVLERAAKVAEAQPYYPDTNIGMRQQWVKDQIAAAIRALKEQP